MPPAKRKKVAARKPKSTKSGGESTARRELVESKLFDVASELFSERGYASTSLQDIADAMGMSRPALYYYVRSKEDILGRLVEEFPRRDAEIVRELVERDDLTPKEKLRAAVTATVERSAEVPLRLRLLIRNEHHLGGELADEYAAARRAVLRTFQEIVEEGTSRGAFRPLNARTTALTIIGMCNWVTWWFSPETDSVRDVATEIAELAIGAVAMDGGEEASVGGLFKQLHLELERLEHLVDAKG
jgi:AcrR family transcriptional regulator